MHTLFCRCAVESGLQKVVLGNPLCAGSAGHWGDQPFIPRLIGVSTLRQVGSICNMGVWEEATATWLRLDVCKT